MDVHVGWSIVQVITRNGIKMKFYIHFNTVSFYVETYSFCKKSLRAWCYTEALNKHSLLNCEWNELRFVNYMIWLRQELLLKVLYQNEI